MLHNRFMGLCTSDMQIWHGKHKYSALPVVMGHELSAEVAYVGPDVQDFKKGDRVVLQPQVVCGECFPCKNGKFNVCEELHVRGVHEDGCACEYMTTDAWHLHKVPENVAMEDAALAEPIAVGIGAAGRAGDLTGKNVAVVGAGTIGNFAAQAAKALGAKAVLITDIFDPKLELAKKCGIDYAINTRERELSDAIDEVFGSFQRADVIIDCAATPRSFAFIIQAARKNSTIVISGNYKEPVQFDLPQLQRREISLLGHMMYTKQEIADALRYLAEGKICTDGIVTQVFPLSKYQDAFEFADAHPEQVVKMLIDCRE